MRKLWLLIFLLGCENAPEAPTIRTASPDQPAMDLGPPGREVIRLIDQVDQAEIVLSGGQASADSASKQWPLKGWKELRTKPIQVWTKPSPVRMGRGIYSQQPADLQLVREGQEIKYQMGLAAGRPVKEKIQKEGRWEYHRNRIVLVTDENPNAQGLLLKSTGDAGADNRFDFSLANLSAEDFVHAPIENGLETRASLLLPAPSSIQFSVRIPKDSALRFGYGLGISAETRRAATANFQILINEEEVWKSKYCCLA